MALLLFGLGGCGDNEAAQPETSSAAELVALLPEDTSALGATDFRTLRSELGLPDDADPIDDVRFGDLGMSEEGQALLEASRSSLAHVGSSSLPEAGADPLIDAIDHGQIEAAAGTLAEFGDGVVVLATSQSFDEIASALEQEGFTRDGNVVSRDEKSEGFSYVAELKGGQIAIGERRPTIDAILDGESEPSPLFSLLEGVEGAILYATSLEQSDATCIDMAGGAENASTGEGTLVIETVGEPASELIANASIEGVTFAESEESEGKLEVAYTSEDGFETGPFAIDRIPTALAEGC